MEYEAKNHNTPRLGSILLIVASSLSLLGILSLYSASSIKGLGIYGDAAYFLKKQVIAVFLCIPIYFAVRALTFSTLRVVASIAAAVALLSLFLVLVPGLHTTAGGAARWLDLGLVRVQTSEPAKLAIVFFLASWLSSPRFDVNSFAKSLLPLLVVVGCAGYLLMLQPDFGTTFLIFFVFVCLLFVAGISRLLILYSTIVLVVFSSFAILSSPYRLRRIVGFLNPWENASNEGFQIVQSFLAFKNGGIVGTGLGGSKQKLHFLPEAHTDFILSVVGEEFGVLGTLLVCAAFFIICSCAFKITLQQQDLYKKFLSFGLACTISCQATLNLGVVTGALPTKGISLPFLSGGTASFVVSFLLIFILHKLSQLEMSTDNDRQKQQA